LAILALALPAASRAAGCPAPNGDAYSSAVLADSPVAYYRLDESAGTTLCDSSASHTNGTFNASGITYGAPGALGGSSDTAVSADGSNGVIGTGGSVGPTGNHSFTLEGWVRSTASTQSQALVDMGGVGQGQIIGLAMWQNVGFTCGAPDGPSLLALDTYQTCNDWDTRTVGVNLFDQQWHHIAISYDSVTGNVTGYVDGKSLGAEPRHVATLNVQPSAVHVGNWIPDSTLNKFWKGGADEVAVYSSPLSAARIAAHFGAASTVAGRPTGTTVTCTYHVATFSDTCFATVMDAGVPPGVTPTGTVNFASGGGGIFTSGAGCTLAQSISGGFPSCSVEFLPPATGRPTLTGTYVGDAAHAGSAGSTVIRVTSLGTGLLVSQLGISPTSLVAAGSGGSVARRRVTIGATVTYTLRAPARVTFTVQRPAAGRLVRVGRGRRAHTVCQAPARSNRRKPRCTRWISLRGTFTLIAGRGTHRFRFRGRIGGRTIQPGSYRLVATPSVGGVAGRATTRAFRVKRG
jgi:hypothetical protein